MGVPRRPRRSQKTMLGLRAVAVAVACLACGASGFAVGRTGTHLPAGVRATAATCPRPRAGLALRYARGQRACKKPRADARHARTHAPTRPHARARTPPKCAGPRRSSTAKCSTLGCWCRTCRRPSSFIPRCWACRTRRTCGRISRTTVLRYRSVLSPYPLRIRPPGSPASWHLRAPHSLARTHAQTHTPPPPLSDTRTESLLERVRAHTCAPPRTHARTHAQHVSKCRCFYWMWNQPNPSDAASQPRPHGRQARAWWVVALL